ncbi:MAG: hypothetical protein E6Q97_08950 [Desulfurellales bacterium]|nr:MAG: hypothetical protein E6Q97_08950 [Desulfurellales bacterium]
MATATQLGIEQVGSRVYITGNSYPVKERLKAVGCHWDAERKQWWIGTGKRETIEAVLAGTDGAEPTETEKQEQLSRKPLIGKIEYKGRVYFGIGYSTRTRKYHLTVMDCSIEFWALETECTIVKQYEARQYRGQSIPQTIAGLRRFMEQQKNSATRRVQCVECDAWHNVGESCRECGGC